MIKKIITTIFATLCVIGSFAQVTTATAVPSSYTNCSVCGGSTNWGFYSGGMSVITDTVGEYSSTALLGNFGFNIPSNAVIQGVELTVGTYTGGANHFKDSVVKLTLNNTIIGANKTQNANFFYFATRVYGGPTDLWSNTLTPADVNSSSFGVAFSAKHTFSTSAPYDIFILNGLAANTLPLLKVYYFVSPTGLNSSNLDTQKLNCYYSNNKIIIKTTERFSEQKITIKLVDPLGRIILNETKYLHRDGINELNTKDLKGIYYLNIVGENDLLFNKKIYIDQL